jgi:hypothetical protein
VCFIVRKTTFELERVILTTLYLVGARNGRSRVAGSTHEIRTLVPQLVHRCLWLEQNGKLVNLRSGGTTRGRGSISGLEGQGEDQRIFEAPRS